MKERESWIDSWKGMLIFLVVLGHVVGMMYHFTADDARAAMRYVYRFIYLFHMPAFFLLAGVLNGSRFRVQGSRFDASQFRSFVWRKFQRLMIPYFFWGVVSIVIFLTMTAVAARMGGNAADGYYGSRMFDFPWWRPFVSLLHAGFWPNGEGFRCNSVLWFLPCMFCVLLAQNAVQSLKFKVQGRTSGQSNNLKSNNQTIILSLIFLSLGGVLRLYVGPLPWCLDRVPRFLAFVLIGEWIGNGGYSVQSEAVRIPLLHLCLGLLLFAVGVVYFPDLRAAYLSWTWYFVEAGMALLGGVLSMALARIVDCRLLAGLGVASLGVMLVHKFPVMLVQGIVGRFGGLEVWGVGGFVVGVTVGVTAVSWLVTAGLRRRAPWSVGALV